MGTFGHFGEELSCRVQARHHPQIMRLSSGKRAGLFLFRDSTVGEGGWAELGTHVTAWAVPLDSRPTTPGLAPSLQGTHLMGLMWVMLQQPRPSVRLASGPLTKWSSSSPGAGWQFQEVIYIILQGLVPRRRRLCPPAPALGARGADFSSLLCMLETAYSNEGQRQAVCLRIIRMLRAVLCTPCQLTAWETRSADTQTPWPWKREPLKLQEEKRCHLYTPSRNPRTAFFPFLKISKPSEMPLFSWAEAGRLPNTHSSAVIKAFSQWDEHKADFISNGCFMITFSWFNEKR